MVWPLPPPSPSWPDGTQPHVCPVPAQLQMDAGLAERCGAPGGGCGAEGQEDAPSPLQSYFTILAIKTCSNDSVYRALGVSRLVIGFIIRALMSCSCPPWGRSRVGSPELPGEGCWFCLPNSKAQLAVGEGADKRGKGSPGFYQRTQAASSPKMGFWWLRSNIPHGYTCILDSKPLFAASTDRQHARIGASFQETRLLPIEGGR